MEKPRLYALAGCSLVIYALPGWQGYKGWRGHREAVKLVASAEQYRTTHNGALAECAATSASTSNTRSMTGSIIAASVNRRSIRRP